MYDIEKIKEYVRPIDVISYLGVQIKRSGSTIFIRCPEHEERTGSVDRRISNCKLGDTFSSAYRCYACNAKGDLFRLIAKLTGLDLKKDFAKICEIAAESYGSTTLFEMKGTINRKKEKDDTSVYIYLSKEQLEALHLQPHVYPNIYTECYTGLDTVDVDDYHLYPNPDFQNIDPQGFPEVSMLETKPSHFSLPELAEKDPDAYLWLIKTKASSAMLQYKKLAKDDWNMRLAEAGSEAGDISYKAAEIRDYFKNQYLYAESAYKLVATNDEIFDIDDSWLYGYDI